jgi:hypothetical protein
VGGPFFSLSHTQARASLKASSNTWQGTSQHIACPAPCQGHAQASHRRGQPLSISPGPGPYIALPVIGHILRHGPGLDLFWRPISQVSEWGQIRPVIKNPTIAHYTLPFPYEYYEMSYSCSCRCLFLISSWLYFRSELAFNSYC